LIEQNYNLLFGKENIYAVLAVLRSYGIIPGTWRKVRAEKEIDGKIVRAPSSCEGV
jgi:hypothetical protein